MTAPGQNEPAGQAASTAYLLAEAGIPIMEIVNLEELREYLRICLLRRLHQIAWSDWRTDAAHRDAAQKLTLLRWVSAPVKGLAGARRLFRRSTGDGTRVANIKLLQHQA